MRLVNVVLAGYVAFFAWVAWVVWGPVLMRLMP